MPRQKKLLHHLKSARLGAADARRRKDPEIEISPDLLARVDVEDLDLDQSPTANSD
jgi:hypothetical protein